MSGASRGGAMFGTSRGGKDPSGLFGAPAIFGSVGDPKGIDSGQSRMKELGNRLATTYNVPEIGINNATPIMVHQINARVLCDMFRDMFKQLLGPHLWTIAKEMGDLEIPYDVVNILAKSLAFDAVTAAAGVCYNKARRQDPSIVRFHSRPPPSFGSFPTYIAALISSIGPVQCSFTSSRQIHVPLIDSTDLQALMPCTYKSTHHSILKKFQATNMLFANIQPCANKSSAWWTFWPVQDAHSVLNLDVSMPGWTVFSPVKSGEVEDHLKLAVLFARKPLSQPGLGPWSHTDWYERDALKPFIDLLPNPADFPPETREFPGFWASPLAFHATVETRYLSLEAQDNDAATQSTKRGRNPAGMGDNDQGKRRKLVYATKSAVKKAMISEEEALEEIINSVGTGSVEYTPRQIANNGQDGCIRQYRIVYHYFNHVSLQDITDSALSNFVSTACQSA